MKNLVVKAISFFAIIVIITSCSYSKNSTKNNDNSQSMNILNGKWIVVKIDDKELTAENSEQSLPTIEFNVAQVQVSGSGGCNRYGGSVKIDAKTITFGTLAATRMMCQNMGFENLFFKAITNTTFGYNIVNKKLMFTEEGKARLILQKVD